MNTWQPIACKRLIEIDPYYAGKTGECINYVYGKSVSCFKLHLVMHQDMHQKYNYGDTIELNDVYVVTYIDTRDFSQTISRVTETPIKCHSIECLKRYNQMKRVLKGNNVFSKYVLY